MASPIFKTLPAVKNNRWKVIQPEEWTVASPTLNTGFMDVVTRTLLGFEASA
jgi:hypothetical protein